MPDRIYVGFGPHGGAMAAQAMETGRLEKKEKLDEEQKNQIAEATMALQGFGILCIRSGINNPLEILQDGKLTGNPEIDKKIPAVLETLKPLSPYGQGIAKKSANGILEGVIKQVINEQTRQQAEADRTMGYAKTFNQFTPFPGQVPNTLGQMPPEPTVAMQNMPPGTTNTQWGPNYQGQPNQPGAASIQVLGANPPPQKPPTQRFVRDATGKYVPVKEGVQGYTKPPAPKEPKAPKVATFNVEGGGTVQREWTPTGGWKDIPGTLSTPKETSTIQAATLDIEKAETVIGELEKTWNQLPHVSGVPGRIAGYGQIATAKIGANPQVKAYQDFADATVAPLIRGLGEKGNLSDTDVKRALKAIPRYPDTKEEATQKIKLLKGLIAGTKKNVQNLSVNKPKFKILKVE